MKQPYIPIFALIVLCAVSVSAQTSSVQPEVSNVIAVLTGSVETKTAHVGDEVFLNTISDVFVDGAIVIPRGSKLTGHLSEVLLKSKDQPESVLAFSVEEASLRSGVNIPLQAIVAALAAPRKDSLATDPTFGMLHSNEPKMVGGASSAAGSGNLGASSKANSNAAVATANLQGKMDQPTILDKDSQGALDLEGLNITWRLLSPPPLTVITSKSKNLKLESGTQMLLRMAPPRLPR
jgi:hypothetical protein